MGTKIVVSFLILSSLLSAMCVDAARKGSQRREGRQRAEVIFDCILTCQFCQNLSYAKCPSNSTHPLCQFCKNLSYAKCPSNPLPSFPGGLLQGVPAQGVRHPELQQAAHQGGFAMLHSLSLSFFTNGNAMGKKHRWGCPPRGSVSSSASPLLGEYQDCPSSIAQPTLSTSIRFPTHITCPPFLPHQDCPPMTPLHPGALPSPSSRRRA